MTILLGLDKPFLPVGNRRWHEPLLSGRVQHLSAHTPMGVYSLTRADILIPTVLEQRDLSFTPRQGGRHRVHHDHLTDATSEVPPERPGEPTGEPGRVLDVGDARDHIPRAPQRSKGFCQGLRKQGTVPLTGLFQKEPDIAAGPFTRMDG